MRRWKNAACQRGSAALEFVAVMPFFLLVALGGLQIGVTGWTTTLTTDSARAAARAASLGQSPVAAAHEALPAGLTATAVSGGHVANGYTYTVTVKVPSVFPIWDSGTVTRTVSMPGIS